MEGCLVVGGGGDAEYDLVKGNGYIGFVWGKKR